MILLNQSIGHILGLISQMKIIQMEFTSDELILGRAVLGKELNQLINCVSTQLL